ncbi:PaaI family thioesterase [Nostoc sp. CENA67]|uniref:PaaI family thioesterase n=1 Tax=Amazonocrinis nigriterrae CENA67 TaxID=2794033 RepID=A0A8J7HSQ6_9NOST|nr:PaaI family thioesterase [Amazonocrinis nigriterrae]MBH8565211.1 PaaI family thioesterase [Amazonocrinis nigriterrae CENA67]
MDATIKTEKLNKPVAKIRTPANIVSLREAIQTSPFTVWTNAEITACEDGFAELIVPMREELKQHNGFTHGAVIGFLIDSACCWAAASKVGDVVTAEYKLNFIAPAVGEKLIARGYVIKSTFSQVITRADVFSVKGTKENLVATGLATVTPYG